MYYLRKLSKYSTLDLIDSLDDVFDIPADLLRQEFPTTNNTLSFWRFDSFERINDTLKAILLSCSYIEKTKFFIVDDDLLSKYSIETDCSNPGMTGYLGFDYLHTDFCNLTYKKIGDVLMMIKDIIHISDYTYQLSRDEAKELIKSVYIDGKIDESKINDKLKKDIEKYIINTN